MLGVRMLNGHEYYGEGSLPGSSGVAGDPHGAHGGAVARLSAALSAAQVRGVRTLSAC